MVLCYPSHEMGLSHTHILSPKIGVIFLIISRSPDRARDRRRKDKLMQRRQSRRCINLFPFPAVRHPPYGPRNRGITTI